MYASLAEFTTFLDTHHESNPSALHSRITHLLAWYSEVGKGMLLNYAPELYTVSNDTIDWTVEVRSIDLESRKLVRLNLVGSGVVNPSFTDHRYTELDRLVYYAEVFDEMNYDDKWAIGTFVEEGEHYEPFTGWEIHIRCELKIMAFYTAEEKELFKAMGWLQREKLEYNRFACSV